VVYQISRKEGGGKMKRKHVYLLILLFGVLCFFGGKYYTQSVIPLASAASNKSNLKLLATLPDGAKPTCITSKSHTAKYIYVGDDHGRIWVVND
jgi:hypothetical protein